MPRPLEEIAYDYVQLNNARSQKIVEHSFQTVTGRHMKKQAERPSFEEFALHQEMLRRVGPDHTCRYIQNARSVIKLMGG